MVLRLPLTTRKAHSPALQIMARGPGIVARQALKYLPPDTNSSASQGVAKKRTKTNVTRKAGSSCGSCLFHQGGRGTNLTNNAVATSTSASANWLPSTTIRNAD